MFDIELPGLEDLSAVDDHALVAAVAGWGRVEAAAAARRLAVIAELVDRRTSGEGARARWACDGWDATAAEVSAAAGSTRGRASNQMYVATALRHRLPRVAAIFADGTLSAALVGTIVWHTMLIEDLGVLAVVDSILAREARSYGQLSAVKTIAAIHAVIEAHDPAAVRRGRDAARSRDLVVDLENSESGTTALWGRLYAHDAAVLDRRLATMAHSVCEDDPRTIAQRRADALAALAAGADRLACACDDPNCPNRTDRAGAPARPVVVHVVADATAVDTPVDPERSGGYRQRRPGAPSDRAVPDSVAEAKPVQILGGPIIPAPLLAELIRTGGAVVRPLCIPGPDHRPEPNYRPSAGLADFVRCRDLTCRFPGCDQPADGCDIDHAIAWGDGGLTHPSNLRLLCRKHHLLKTFWGWHDRQFPDGTIVWTSPTGHSYTTRPGSRLLFPGLCRSTGRLPAARPPSRATGCRDVMMPIRRRTRAQDRRAGIAAERAHNLARVVQQSAESGRPPP